MFEAVNHSQPSVVTSPTHTDVVYSLAPPASRHGMIAVAVAGVLLLAVIVAVMVGSPDNDTLEYDPGAAPLPSFSNGAALPSSPPKPVPTQAPTASASASASASTSTPRPFPRPVPRPTSNPFRQPKPDPVPGDFKPKEL